MMQSSVSRSVCRAAAYLNESLQRSRATFFGRLGVSRFGHGFWSFRALWPQPLGPLNANVRRIFRS